MSVDGKDQYLVRRQSNGRLATINAYEATRDPQWLRSHRAALEVWLAEREAEQDVIQEGERVKVQLRGEGAWAEFRVGARETDDDEDELDVDAVRAVLITEATAWLEGSTRDAWPPPWLAAVCAVTEVPFPPFNALRQKRILEKLASADDDAIVYFSDLYDICQEAP